jgi:hypothetical protein
MSVVEIKQTIDFKDLYKTLIDTRNFEINLFWQRSNYFLVLNTGIAFGFFNVKEYKFQFAFAVFGLLASMLWYFVCLGGKYWQTRWEQRLADFEREHLPQISFFDATESAVRDSVEKGLKLQTRKGMQRLVYEAVLHAKPSVSYSMIRLSALFFLGWTVFLGIYFAIGRNPFA